MASTHTHPANVLAAAERQAQIVALVNQGRTFREIAAELDLSKSQVHRSFHAAVNRIPAENVHEYRERQLADLALARQVVLDVLSAKHVVISNGHVVSVITGVGEDGKPVYGDPYEDDGPVLAAVDRLVKLNEREAAILGSDAQKRVELGGSVRYEVVGLEQEDPT